MSNQADNENRKTIDRRNLLLGTSTLVAAATLTSEVIAQAQKAAPAPAAIQSGAASGRKPNILLLLVDDLG